MGIGYASVNSIILSINGNLKADLQDEIYITEVTYDSSVATEYKLSKINKAYQTLFNINVNSNLLIKPNYTSIRNKKISYFYNEISNITILTDIYGFNKSTYDILDTHLIKNNEWRL